MKRSLLIIFMALVAIPVAVVTWLGTVGYRQQRATFTERYRILARGQLEEIDRQVRSFRSTIENELRMFGDAHTYTVERLRSIPRTSRFITQLFVLDDEGVFLHPPADGIRSNLENAFLANAKELGLVEALVAGSEAAPGRTNDSGWHTWFLGDGINFLFWQKANANLRVGVVIDRIALISRVVALLPETNTERGSETDLRVVLNDARGRALYQWGNYKPRSDERAVSTLPLSEPFGAWNLEIYLDLEDGGGATSIGDYLFVLVGVSLVGLVFLFLAIYFYRRNASVVNDAMRRVSFVNQVSHELRTPLTNIRIYADLLEPMIEGVKERGHLDIVRRESLRLSRMIGNVLTFSRLERGGFEAHYDLVDINRLIEKVVDAFRPTFEEKSFEIVVSGGAPQQIRSDPDLIEQVVANLLGNVEKYAPLGRYVQVGSFQNRESTVIVVEDRGPGIPNRERKKVFKPFYRASNLLTDGVAGAGIGLSISKKLAEELGGALSIEDAEVGATFRFEIPNQVKEKAR